MKKIKHTTLYIILLFLIGCGNNSENILRLLNMDKSIEGSVNSTYAHNIGLINEFEVALATLYSHGASPVEIERVKKLKKTSDQINEISKDINNTLVGKSYSLFNILLKNELTECEISWNNYIDNLGKLDFTDPEDIKEITSEMEDVISKADIECMDLYKNVNNKMIHLFKNMKKFDVSLLKLAPYKKSMDVNGFSSMSLNTNSISILEKLNVKTNSFDGFDKFGSEEINLKDLIHKYRDNLCSLIATHTSDTLADAKGKPYVLHYELDTTLFPKPTFMATSDEVYSFELEVEAILEKMVF